MLQRILITFVVTGFVSSNVSAGVHAPVHWRHDRVYVKALYVAGAVFSVIGGSGIGAFISSSLGKPEDMSCCECERACGSQHQTGASSVTTSNVCHFPLDCAKYSEQYKAGCQAVTADENRSTIVGVVVGAAIGVLGYSIFCGVKIYQHYRQKEAQPLVPKKGEIV